MNDDEQRRKNIKLLRRIIVSTALMFLTAGIAGFIFADQAAAFTNMDLDTVKMISAGLMFVAITDAVALKLITKGIDRS